MTPRAYYATKAVAAAAMRDNPGRRARVLHRIPPRGAAGPWGAAGAFGSKLLQDGLLYGVGEVFGETAERDAVDLYAFTSVINRHLDQTGRQELISLLWEMVYADGERHELEDNIVWRVSELVGIDGPDRVALRQRVAERVSARDENNG